MKRELVKFMTCGSVDDGKSTLIGRLMFDAGCLHPDQQRALEAESVQLYGEAIDYSLLLDGLEAEREQRITIDVAYRFFSTGKRSFIIADTPGHEQYTRNMAVGASFADLAVILVDAAKGVLPQTERHFRICRLMGIRDIIFAVNKMDSVGYSEKSFDAVRQAVLSLADGDGEANCSFVPVCATGGDNVVHKSGRTPWYGGMTLLEMLEDFSPDKRPEDGFYMPVQRVSKTAGTPRGYQGCAECGSIAAGDGVTVFPGGEKSRVRGILVSGGEAQSAGSGSQITLTLEDEIDVSRGCVLCAGFTPGVCTQFRARVLWTDDLPAEEGKSYFMKLATSRVPVTLRFGRQTDGESVKKNDIAECTVCAAAPVVADRFEAHRTLGEFILIDRVSHATAAWGRVTGLLDNNYIYPSLSAITRGERERMKGQKAATLWLTGLPSSGKSTLANELEKRLFALGKHTFILDGDTLRSGINAGLGFSEADRAENIRVTAHIARLMNDAGLIVIAALVSPREADRASAAEIIGDGFFAVYLSASAKVCESRDAKGYYRKAREGLISGFTGVSDPYEPPASPDLTLDTASLDPAECADAAVAFLRSRGII